MTEVGEAFPVSDRRELRTGVGVGHQAFQGGCLSSSGPTSMASKTIWVRISSTRPCGEPESATGTAVSDGISRRHCPVRASREARTCRLVACVRSWKKPLELGRGPAAEQDVTCARQRLFSRVAPVHFNEHG